MKSWIYCLVLLHLKSCGKHQTIPQICPWWLRGAFLLLVGDIDSTESPNLLPLFYQWFRWWSNQPNQSRFALSQISISLQKILSLVSWISGLPYKQTKDKWYQSFQRLIPTSLSGERNRDRKIITSRSLQKAGFKKEKLTFGLNFNAIKIDLEMSLSWSLRLFSKMNLLRILATVASNLLYFLQQHLISPWVCHFSPFSTMIILTTIWAQICWWSSSLRLMTLMIWLMTGIYVSR